MKFFRDNKFYANIQGYEGYCRDLIFRWHVVPLVDFQIHR